MAKRRTKKKARIQRKKSIEKKVERKKEVEFKNIFHPLVREGLPTWAKIIAWIIVILTIVLMTFESINEVIIEIIGLLIFLYCGKKCFELASEINKSTTLAYIIGLFFGLFGLLEYWIYYKMIKTNVKKWTMAVCLLIIAIVLLAIYLVLLFIGYSPA